MADLEKLTRVYIKIRDAKATLSADFKKKDAELTEQMNTIKQHLLDYCKENGVESVRTPAGLFFRTTKTRYWTSDWEAMHQFILDHGLTDFLEKRLNQSAVKAFLEENPEQVPPGLNSDSEYSITVRKA
jgi:hypothetical protein